MNVSLTPELERFVQQKVASGLYYSASEVIREGLRLLKEREELQQVRLQEVRLQEMGQNVQPGLESSEAVPLNLSAIETKGRQRRQRRSAQ